jgi:hypothetical protein
MNSEYNIRSLTDVHAYEGKDVTPPVDETGCSL